MGFFSKIKHHIKNITKSAEQKTKEQKDLAESAAKEAKEKLEIVHKAKTKVKGLIKNGKKKKK